MTFIQFHNEFQEKHQSLTSNDNEICGIDFSRIYLLQN